VFGLDSSQRNRLDDYSLTPLASLVTPKLHLVSIVHDFVVAPCGGMTGKPIAQADRRFIDGAGLDNVRPLGGDLFRRRLTHKVEIDDISAY
jgi:hypothetical protein